MRALSATELSRMQDLAEDIMPDTGVVTRQTYVDDANGNPITTTATVGTYSCRLEPSAVWNFPVEIEMAERKVGSNAWVIAFPLATDVQEDDYVTIDSKIYEVIGVQDDSSYANETLAMTFER